VILSLCRELQAQGKPRAVLCYWDSIGLANYAESPLKVVELAPSKDPLSKALSLRRSLQSIAKAGGPVPVLFNIQSAYHAGLVAGGPYHLRISETYSLLDFVPEGAAPARQPLRRRLMQVASKALCQVATRRGIQNATCPVTNTVALRKEMQQLYGRSAEVIYLGGFGAPMVGTPERAAVPVELHTVSRLQSSKRIDWILQALADV
jgi:hypothetical protein